MESSPSPEAGFTAYKSGQDASVNWDRPADVGRLEARYVRCCADYFVVYLSSQTGCAPGYRMCHLTATGQTRLRDASLQVQLPGDAEAVVDPRELRAEAVVVRRHQHCPARRELAERPVELGLVL